MHFKTNKLRLAILGSILSTGMAHAIPASSPETYNFLFSGNGATASGSLTTNAPLSTFDGGEGSFGDLTALDVTVAGASSGNGSFTLSDFSHYLFEYEPGLDFSTNLYGQEDLQDFNLFGDAPAPNGTSPMELQADGGEGALMILSCLQLSTVGSCSLISLDDLQESLSSASLGFQSLMMGNGTLVNGAHSRPLSRLVAEGENTFWGAGDWGRDDHGPRNGTVGLAEIGIGHNYGPAQVNVSFGYLGSDQDTAFGGEVESRGKYLMVEGIVPIEKYEGVYLTLGTYGQWSDLDSRRGYDASGSTEYSTGNSDTSSWGIRARIDWQNAIATDSVTLSPYADLWHSYSKIDAYTETGGSLPASYDGQNQSVTDLRMGLNSMKPIENTAFNFLANIEAAHRFDSKASATSGTVATLGAFSFDGQDFNQTWLKAGFGVEGKLGKGKLSVMVNGTTEGEMPSTWLASSYQISF